MKNVFFLLIAFVALVSTTKAQRVAIGAGSPTPDASSVLDLQATDKGFLVPRVANPASIPSPATGLLLYNTATNRFNFYNGTAWTEVGATGPAGPAGPTGLLSSGSAAGNTPFWNGTTWVLNSSNIFNNGGNVGIGINPTQRLDVAGNMKMSGNYLYTNGSSTTYGAITVQGGKNGWSGINFKLANGSNAKTLMMHPTHSGVFNTADNNWDWYWTNGTLTDGTVPVSRLAVDAAGLYMHLGAWAGTWNAGNGVLVQGAAYWWGLNPSDRNLKKNINPIEQAELKSLTDDLLKTKLYRYEYIEDPMGKGLNHVGMLADEAPSQMRINGEGGINIIEGFMMSVAAIKILKQEKDALELRLMKLEEQINNMR